MINWKINKPPKEEKIYSVTVIEEIFNEKTHKWVWSKPYITKLLWQLNAGGWLWNGLDRQCVGRIEVLAYTDIIEPYNNGEIVKCLRCGHSIWKNTNKSKKCQYCGKLFEEVKE